MDIEVTISDMKKELKKIKPALQLSEAKVKTLQADFEKARDALDKAVAERDACKADIDALEMAIEALESGNFAAQKAAKKNPINEKPVKVSKADERKNANKKAHVLKLNQYDNVLDRWPTQKAAARGMNWDQSSVCKFMKLSKEVQLKRKGFYLAWDC